MKRFFPILAMFSLLCASSFAFAASVDYGWSGPSISIRAGLSRIAISGEPIDSATGATLEASAEYAYALTPSVVLGGDIFYEWNPKQRHTQDEPCVSEVTCPKGHTEVGVNVYGADALLGFPVGAHRAWMPYLKVGYGRAVAIGHISGSDGAARYGFGVQWRASRNYGFSVQFMRESFRFSETGPVYFGIASPSYEDEVRNSSLTVGFNWHFD